MLKLALAPRLLQTPLRGWVVPRAHVSAKPARTPTSPMASEQDRHLGKMTLPLYGQNLSRTAPDVHMFCQEQAIGLSVMFLSFLTPAGWVLFHLESYKTGSTK